MKIQTQDLSREYGTGEIKVQAIRPCSFCIEASEQVAVVGSSGSGKSTLLHLLGGLDNPTSGSVEYDGTDIYKKGDDDLSQFRLQNIGFVFQAYNLLPELTAYENIVLPLLLDGKQPDKDYLEDIIRQLDLKDRLDHLPGQLSGGQQQRVALARALANKPQVLLCDEPTGNLDSKTTNHVITLLNQTADSMGLTLILVTHNEKIASQYQRVITVADGVVGGDL